MKEKTFFKPYPPEIHALYDDLLAILKRIGPLKVEVKKTSIHLVNTRAFAGVHPKKSYLGVNLVLSRARTRTAQGILQKLGVVLAKILPIG